MSNSLFDQFEPVSAKQWKQNIQMALKGADYNQTLLTDTPEGIAIKPFYNAEDLNDPLLTVKKPEGWAVTQAIFVDDLRIARGLILKSIAGGAEALVLTADAVFEATALFKNVDLKGIRLFCQFNFIDPDFYKDFAKKAKAAGAKTHLGVDIIGNLGQTGNWFKDNAADHQFLDGVIDTADAASVLSVNASLYGNSGANAVQQLAYALAHTNEYLNHLAQTKPKVTEVHICYNWAIGPNYFMEIGKLRAFRILLDAVATVFEFKVTPTLLATPTTRNKTIYDPNVNMLRTTTECMSAILGGADAVCNLPYDWAYHKSNEFGERISRNQLLILKHESYFDQVSNPADGSYYIEDLTHSLASKSLDLFKQIEASGGFVKALFAGTIQRKIKEQDKREQVAFDEDSRALLGTNLYPNKEEKIKDTLQIYPFLKTEKRKTIISPIMTKRITEEHEQKRLDNE